MSLTPNFHHFMHGLLSDLGIQHNEDGPKDEGYQIVSQNQLEIDMAEGDANDVIFCTKLDVMANQLSVTKLLELLAKNGPHSGVPVLIVGLHEDAPHLCVWCREAMENLHPDHCLNIIRRLIEQASTLQQALEATTT